VVPATSRCWRRELVGPNGAVVGIDRNGDVLIRARAAGYANDEFREGAAEDFVDPVPFDLAIGRYVLIHQADPTTFIRSAASHVRPDGLIAFDEVAVYALPPVPLWEQCWNWAIIKRPFRVYVDPTQYGADVAFAVMDRVRAEMLHRVGLSDLLKPHQTKAE
jgi:SAM-dependent methyltransferase